MPWQSSGVFARLYSWVSDASAGVDISSTRMDADTDDITQGMAQCRVINGAAAGTGMVTANLPMGGFRHINVGAAVNPTDYARFDQVVPAGGGTFTGAATFAAGVTVRNPTGPGLQVTSGIIVDGLDVNTTDGIVDAGPLSVTGQAQFHGSAVVAGGLVTDTILCGGVSTFTGGLTANGGITTNGITAGGVNCTGALTVTGQTRLNGAAVVAGGLTTDGFAVTGSSSFTGGLTANGGITTNAITAGAATVTGPATFQAGINLSGVVPGNPWALIVSGSIDVGNNAVFGGTVTAGALTVNGATQSGTLNVVGATQSGSLHVVGDTQSNTLEVVGAAQAGSLTVVGTAQSGSLVVAGAAGVGSLQVNGTLTAEGAVDVKGFFTAEGNAQLIGTTAVTGPCSFTQGAEIGGVVPGNPWALIVSGSIDIGTDGLFGGTVTAGAFNPTSSIAIKRDIRELEVRAVDLVCGVAARSYRRLAAPDHEEWGFLAEELAAVSAGVLGDGKTVSLIGLIATLWRAVQELAADDRPWRDDR